MHIYLCATRTDMTNDARHGILLGQDIYETFSKDLDLPVPIQHDIF